MTTAKKFRLEIVRRNETRLSEQDRYLAAIDGGKNDGDELLSLGRDNLGHNALWPEDQYLAKKSSGALGMKTVKRVCRCVNRGEYSEGCVWCNGRGVIDAYLPIEMNG